MSTQSTSTTQRNEIKALRKSIHWDVLDFLDWLNEAHQTNWDSLSLEAADQVIAYLKDRKAKNELRETNKLKEASAV